MAVKALPHQGDEQGARVDVPAVGVHMGDRLLQTGRRADEGSPPPPPAAPQSNGFHGPLRSFLPHPEGDLHDGLAQRGVVDAHRRRLLGHQAGGGHAGQGVDLQKVGGAVLGDDEVRPGVHRQPMAWKTAWAAWPTFSSHSGGISEGHTSLAAPGWYLFS